MIAKTEDTGLLPEATKKILFGRGLWDACFFFTFTCSAHGGDVILHLTYTSGSTIDLANIQKAASAGNGSDTISKKTLLRLRRHLMVIIPTNMENITGRWELQKC